MFKKAIWVMIPFVLIFLLGLFLLLRPQYRVPIVEVVDTFLRRSYKLYLGDQKPG